MKSKSVSTHPPRKVRTLLSAFYALPVLLVIGICGYLVWARATHQGPPVRHLSSKPFASVAVGKFSANLFSQGDQLRPTDNDLFIEFRNGQAALTDVGNVTFEMFLKMPDMVMHSIGRVMRTGTPGQYRTTVDPQVAGDWSVRLAYDGPQGVAETNFPTVVK